MRTISDEIVINFTQGEAVDYDVLDDGTVLDNDPTDDEETGGADPEFGPNYCAGDRLMFITDFTSIDYWVRPNSGFQSVTPSVLQFIPGCPISCTLDEAGTGMIVRADIFSIAA